MGDGQMRRKRWGGRALQSRVTLGAVFSVAVAVGACGGANEGDEAKSPDSVDEEAPSTLSPMAQLQAIPRDLQAQADNLTKPIDDVQKVTDQLTSIPKRYGISAGQLAAMAKATLERGSVNGDLGADLPEAAKVEIKAALKALAQAVADLRATPEKVEALGAKLATLVTQVPVLVAQVTASATATAANPFAAADAKAMATADIQKVKQVQADVMKVVSDTRAKIVGVPGMATGALKKLMAALEGGDEAGPAAEALVSAHNRGGASSPSTGGRTAPSGSKVPVVRVRNIGSSQEAHIRHGLDAVFADHGLVAAAGAEGGMGEGRHTPGAPPAGAGIVVTVARGDDDSINVSLSKGDGADTTKVLSDTTRVPAAVAELLEESGLSLTVRSGTLPTVGASTPGQASARARAPSDQVLLKDGTTIRGRVLNQIPGTAVIIETADGAQRTIPWERVKEVDVAPPGKR